MVFQSDLSPGVASLDSYVPDVCCKARSENHVYFNHTPITKDKAPMQHAHIISWRHHLDGRTTALSFPHHRINEGENIPMACHKSGNDSIHPYSSLNEWRDMALVLAVSIML